MSQTASGATAISKLILSDRPCPLCGGHLGDAMLIVAQPDRFERSVGILPSGYWRVWRACEGCGASINEQRAGDAEKVAAIAQEYYEVDIGGDVASKYHLIMGLAEEKSDNAGRARRILQKFCEQSFSQKSVRPDVIRVLDVGAGTGVFLSKLRQLCHEIGINLDAVAIEPDPHAARHLRTLGGLQVVEDILDDRFAQTDFDIVTFNKVLEHIQDPRPVLLNAQRLLKQKSGLLYAEVPDLQTIYRRPADDNILGAMHHHLYSPASLEGILSSAGLIPIGLQRIVEPSGKLTIYGFAIPECHYQFLTSGQK